MTTFTDLTELETKALQAFIDESDSNGHDFGVFECVDWPRGQRKQLGALYTNLLNKGYIQYGDETYVNGTERILQYVLNYEKCGIENPNA